MGILNLYPTHRRSIRVPAAHRDKACLSRPRGREGSALVEAWLHHAVGAGEICDRADCGTRIVEWSGRNMGDSAANSQPLLSPGSTQGIIIYYVMKLCKSTFHIIELELCKQIVVDHHMSFNPGWGGSVWMCVHIRNLGYVEGGLFVMAHVH